jgi:hypothetical protein
VCLLGELCGVVSMYMPSWHRGIIACMYPGCIAPSQVYCWLLFNAYCFVLFDTAYTFCATFCEAGLEMECLCVVCCVSKKWLICVLVDPGYRVC